LFPIFFSLNWRRNKRKHATFVGEKLNEETGDANVLEPREEKRLEREGEEQQQLEDEGKNRLQRGKDIRSGIILIIYI
jgi:hypothetical protein